MKIVVEAPNMNEYNSDRPGQNGWKQFVNVLDLIQLIMEFIIINVAHVKIVVLIKW